MGACVRFSVPTKRICHLVDVIYVRIHLFLSDKIGHNQNYDDIFLRIRDNLKRLPLGIDDLHGNMRFVFVPLLFQGYIFEERSDGKWNPNNYDFSNFGDFGFDRLLCFKADIVSKRTNIYVSWGPNSSYTNDQLFQWRYFAGYECNE